jgi:hypothetical protein
MQRSARTTGIEAISKAGKALLSVFHGDHNRNLLVAYDLRKKVTAISFGQLPDNFPQPIDYKHTVGLLGGPVSLRNIFAIIGG